MSTDSARYPSARELSIVYPYYNNEACLSRQLELWASLPPGLARRVEYVLVDDGSPRPAAVARDFPGNLTLVRIREDKRWNQHGARNLGLKLAEGEWVLATDIDHILDADGVRELLSMQRDPRTVYFFGRLREDGSPRNSHPNSFLVEKRAFWEIGGYDEDFCGHYGKGDLFLRTQFERSCKIVELERPVLVELNNGATPGLNRETRRNRWLSKWKRRLIERGKYRNGRTLRFEWEILGRWRTPSV
jgi:glycosyltransferase involved in cell wall biosynthesis